MTTIQDQIKAVHHARTIMMATPGGKETADQLNDAAGTLAAVEPLHRAVDHIAKQLLQRESLIMALRKNLESVLRITLRRLQDGQSEELAGQLKTMLEDLNKMRNEKASNEGVVGPKN